MAAGAGAGSGGLVGAFVYGIAAVVVIGVFLVTVLTCGLGLIPLYFYFK